MQKKLTSQPFVQMLIVEPSTICVIPLKAAHCYWYVKSSFIKYGIMVLVLYWY